MDMIKICAVFRKQLKDTLKNKTILIQFVMFPVLAAVMINTMNIEGMPENYFVVLFATMYIGMAPVTSMAAVISEERETNTLRVLLMSNVKSGEYLLGTGSCIFLACTLGALVFGLLGNYRGELLFYFVLMMCVGILISLLLGAVIGARCRGQMSATSIAVPVMMVISFLPMLASFNEKIEKVSRFLFSWQISRMLEGIGNYPVGQESIIVICGNLTVVILLFIYCYRKYGLE